MNTDVPKVLTKVGGRPMIQEILEKAGGLQAERTVVVLGHQIDVVRPFLPEYVEVVRQQELLGTAHAVNAARSAFEGFEGDVIIMYGDTPFLMEGTISRIVERHNESGAACTLLTVEHPDPKGYGRIVRAEDGRVLSIVEELDATEEQRDIHEINVGLYCFRRRDLFEALQEVKANPRKGEYYLTDVIEILGSKGVCVEAVKSKDALEAFGVNSLEDLEKARNEMAKKGQNGQ